MDLLRVLAHGVALSSFTRLGANIWRWPSWVSLDPCARVVWLGLFTSPEARRFTPGLFEGSIVQIAEACRIPHPDTIAALDLLIERELAEYDRRTHVLRLTELPDAGEWPTNGRVVRGWWTKFRGVPECAVRDAHVPTLRWLMDEGARGAGKQLSADHQTAWAETFGTVQVPAPRRRGVRRLVGEPGNDAQPSLFDPPKASAPVGDPPWEGSSSVTHPDNKNNHLDTLSRPSRKDQDPGSRIPDLISGSRPEPIPDGASRDQVLRRPALALVPAFTPEDLLVGIAQGAGDLVRPVVPPSLRAALCTLIAQLSGAGMGVDEAPLVGKWLRRRCQGRPTYPARHLPPPERLAAWCVTPGIVLQAVTEQREHSKLEDAQRANRESMLDEMGRTLGYIVDDVKEKPDEPEHHDPAIARV